MEKIFVWVKRPGESPKHVWMSNNLQNLQRYVGGYIETVTLDEDIVIICNEEGRIMGLPYNCEVYGIDFCGDIIFAGIDGEEFADCPLDVMDMKAEFPELFEENEKAPAIRTDQLEPLNIVQP